MTADVCCELPSIGASPKISFSHDLNQAEHVPAHSLDSDFEIGFDFSFCTGKRITQHISTADELFSNGKILPIQTKSQVPTWKGLQIQEHEPTMFHRKRQPSTRGSATAGSEEGLTYAVLPLFHSILDSSTSTNSNANVIEEAKKKRLKEFLFSSFETEEEKSFSKIFRPFKRSTSLNIESRQNSSLIQPLQFVSRSNSAGSAPNPKQNPISNNTHKQNLFSPSPVTSSRSSSPLPAYYPYHSSKTHLVKKNREPQTAD